MAKFNRTISRAIQFLEYIAEQSGGASIAELVAVFSIPKTSVYDIISTLLQTEMLALLPGEGNRYIIGSKAFIIGNQFSSNLDLVRLAGPFLQKLSKELAQTTFLAIENHGYVVYLGKYEPENPIITTAALGSRRPMYCTGLGKALLAGYPDAELTRHLAGVPLKPKTARTHIDLAGLQQDLQRTRKRGYAIDNREQEDFLICVAAPLCDHRGAVLASISSSFIYEGSEKKDIGQQGKCIQKTALAISAQLGYSRTQLYDPS